jgi:site-specific DNA-methyltransferase (adenine-specific)
MYFEIVGSKTVDISNKKQIRTIDIYRSKSLIKPSNSGVLIQGNNLDIMISLLDEYKGKINLIYIDPPYLTGLDFKTRGGSFAYSDKFTREQYYQMMYDRLLLTKELLSDNGSIYVHVDHRTNSCIRLIMDEIFGKNNFRNEIIWWYPSGGDKTKYFQRKHDTILFYSKSHQYIFNANDVLLPYTEEQLKRFKEIDENGNKFYWNTNPRGEKVKTYLKAGIIEYDVWNIGIYAGKNKYPTQKPEALLERIIRASSNEGDLIADFFAGSGTTLAVAQKLNRNWIGVDMGEESIKTIKERMVNLDATFEFKSL